MQDIIKLEIDEAMNGEEAVKLYEKNLLRECSNPLCQRSYILIIMDIGMPLKDGFEASKEILSLQNNLKDFVKHE
jgi:CheY-like chemotaxis protein